MVKDGGGSGGARSAVGSRVRWFIQLGQGQVAHGPGGVWSDSLSGLGRVGSGGSWSRRSLVRWFIWVG